MRSPRATQGRSNNLKRLFPRLSEDREIIGCATKLRPYLVMVTTMANKKSKQRFWRRERRKAKKCVLWRNPKTEAGASC